MFKRVFMKDDIAYHPNLSLEHPVVFKVKVLAAQDGSLVFTTLGHMPEHLLYWYEKDARACLRTAMLRELEIARIEYERVKARSEHPIVVGDVTHIREPEET